MSKTFDVSSFILDGPNLKATHKNKWKTPSQQRDMCDCQRSHCPGCWYPCETCGSNKCSPFCREARKFPLEWERSG